ncbi:MAG TPA: hypothetical protein VKT82_04960 [Ktedonobacterales bacterium]|nr:hypothetical protein [Ktedonobacterales bacterium]
MVTVGTLTHLEAKPGHEAAIKPPLHGTLAAVQQLPATTAWFGIRLGPATFGTLDLFLDEARAAQLFVKGDCGY